MEGLIFFIVHSIFLIIAEFIWAFFIFFVILKILKLEEILFTKKFFYFIVLSSFFSMIINRFFEYIVEDMPITSEIWAKTGNIEHLGIVLVPTFILMYIYFYLASIILKLNSKYLLLISLILGIVTSPWKMLL